MKPERVQPIVERWAEKHFTFIDEYQMAALIGELQEEELGYRLCPHNARRIDCGHCDHIEDMNYDAHRERG